MTAIYSAAFSVVCAVAIAVAGWTGGWVLVAAGGLTVLSLAGGWGDLLRLPRRTGTAVLVAALGVAALAVAQLEGGGSRPLAYFPALLALCVLAAFGHELLARDGRGDLVESVTGTLTGQVVAVQAAGWVLLAQTVPGWNAVVVAVAAVAAARVVGVLPLPVEPVVTAWAGIGVGTAAALVASVFVTGIPPLTAMALGGAVAAVGIALDRLLVEPERGVPSLLAALAWGAAPVAAAGTIGYAIIRIALG